MTSRSGGEVYWTTRTNVSEVFDAGDELIQVRTATAPCAASGDWVALGRGLRFEAEALRPRVLVLVLFARPGRAAREVLFRPGRGARAPVPVAPGAEMEVVKVLAAGIMRFSEAGWWC